MELKMGYKQTEVGVFPEEWNFDYIENIAQINTGSKNTQDHEEDGQYPFFVRSQTVERINTYSYDGEAVLTAGDGVGTGKIFHYINGKFDVHQRVYRMSEFSSRIDGYFFYLYFSSHFYNRIMQMTAKSSVDSVRREMIARMLIPLPPMIEQLAIAEALSDADALIETLEQLITKKRHIKQGAMQELLTGKKRLPGYNNKWEKYTLGQMGNCHRGVSYNPSNDLSPFDTELTIRLLRANNLQGSQVVLSDLQYVHSNCVSEIQYLRLNDILVCMANGNRDLVGKAGRFVVEDGLRYTFGAFMSCFRPDNRIADPEFVFYLFQTEKYRSHIATFLAGSSIHNLTPSNVESLIITIPSDKDEQVAIDTIISDMDAEIAALGEKLTKARLIKQGMMQELLTGRIRLV